MKKLLGIVILFLIFNTLPVSSEINNKDELREFLIKNKMKYISTDGYYRIFTFNEKGKGTYYMDNKKKEMPLIWEVVNKNTLKSGHPQIVEQRGWTILKINFEKKKLYMDLSSINGEKYTFDVMFENSNPSKEQSPKSQEAKNGILVDENKKSKLIAKCETIVKKKWNETLELRDYSISADEQEKQRQKKIEKDINACVEVNSEEVDKGSISNELIVKRDGVTFIKGNPEAFDSSPLKTCDVAAVTWNNCKASYEMSNAPAEIYNDLVEANNVSVYRGEFKDNFPHGSGTLQFKDGTFTYVIFENGMLKKLTDYEGARAYQADKLISMLASLKKNTYQAKPGYLICRSTWKKLISLRNTKNKNTSSYYKIDAFVQTAFDLMLSYKGTNAMDTGNCEKLLSLANE